MRSNQSCNLNLKVSLIAIMGGAYPSSHYLSTFNFGCGQPFMGEPLECGGKSRKAVLNMPPEVKMVFSGFEVGLQVMSGAALTRFASVSLLLLCLELYQICSDVRQRATLVGKHTLTTQERRWTGIAGIL